MRRHLTVVISVIAMSTLVACALEGPETDQAQQAMLHAQSVKVDNNEYDNNGNWDVKMSCYYDVIGHQEWYVRVTIKITDAYEQVEQTTEQRTIVPAEEPQQGEWAAIEPLSIDWTPELTGPCLVETTAVLLTHRGQVVRGSESDSHYQYITF